MAVVSHGPSGSDDSGQATHLCPASPGLALTTTVTTTVTTVTSTAAGRPCRCYSHARPSSACPLCQLVSIHWRTHSVPLSPSPSPSLSPSPLRTVPPFPLPLLPPSPSSFHFHTKPFSPSRASTIPRNHNIIPFPISTTIPSRVHLFLPYLFCIPNPLLSFCSAIVAHPSSSTKLGWPRLHACQYPPADSSVPAAVVRVRVRDISAHLPIHCLNKLLSPAHFVNSRLILSLTDQATLDFICNP